MPDTLIDDEGISPEQETAIVIAAGTGAPCPVETPAGLARYQSLCEDVAYLREHGITLVPPE